MYIKNIVELHNSLSFYKENNIKVYEILELYYEYAKRFNTDYTFYEYLNKELKKLGCLG